MSNPYSRDNEQTGYNNQIITSPQTAVNNLPYGFVPVGDAPVSRKPMVDLGKDDDLLYTGYINCSMYALNELCVGNSHQDLGNDLTAIMPLIVNDRILISSHTIKGCIANFLAAYLKLPISRMNNHRYSFRPNNAFSKDAVILKAAGIIESIDANGSGVIRKFKTDKFAFTTYKTKDGEYYYNPKETKYEIRDHGEKKGYFKFFDYHDGIDGTGTLARSFAGSGRCPSHKSLGVLLQNAGEDPLSNELYQISIDIMKAYQETIRVLADKEIGHLNDHPLLDKDVDIVSKNIKEHGKLNIGDVVFFEHEKNKKEVLTFGKHFRYRWAYSRDLYSFEKDYEPYDHNSLKHGELNIIEELFGYSYGDKDTADQDALPFENRAKSAKVHFSFAEHVSGTGELKKEKWLPRPGSPKPSSFEFYLRENYTVFLSKKKLTGPLTTYGDPARSDFIKKPRLSGRKFYYKTANTPYNDLKDEPEVDKTVKLCNVLVPSQQSFPLFKFRVHYQNLSISELHLLHFSLCLGQNIIPMANKPLASQGLFCHQIGYGKNYGMGAVKIVIDTQNEKEDIFRVKLNPESCKLQLFRIGLKPRHQLNEQCEALKQLMLFSSSVRNYPRYKGEIFQWHTKIKNDDLKARIEKRN